MDTASFILAAATIVGLYMAWNIGANDVANAMATSVGSGALTLKRALIVAAVFEFAGSMLVGGSVTQTISKGIVDIEAFDAEAEHFALGMTCCLLAAASWLHLATYFGWPVSTTHSIVGAVVGFGIVAAGPQAVNWAVLSRIAASWVLSPVMGAVLGFGCFTLLQKLIFEAKSTQRALVRYGPVLTFVILVVLTLSMLYKGLKPLRLDLPLSRALAAALVVGLLAAVASRPWIGRLAKLNSTDDAAAVERVFLLLQVLTACFVAFAHGSNDVANAVGPMAAVYGALNEGIAGEVRVPISVLAIGSVGIVVGLGTYGYRVLDKVGTKITELTPSRGFSAEFAAATTIVLASKLGLPVSTTHTLIGAIVGVGFARSVGAIDANVLRGIVASWFVTVPFTALLSAGLIVAAQSMVVG